MTELAILGTLFWGLALAIAVVAGEEHLGRGLAALEQELRVQLRKLRISGRSAGVWLRGWLLAGLAVLLAGAALGRPWLGALGAGVFIGAPWLGLLRLAAKRRRRIDDQLADAMVAFSGAVRSGLSIPLALEVLARQCPAPIQHEFRQIFGEYQMGKTLEVCLREAKQRLQSQNFALFAAALEASRASGGKLNETVERIALSVRELQRLERKLEAETAQARKSALYMACAPPLVLAVYYFLFDAEQTTRLFTEPAGVALLGVAVVLNIVAALWARKILNPAI